MRRWSSMPGRFISEINLISGLVGFSGVAVSVAGYSYIGGFWGVTLAIAGCVLTSALFVVALWRSIPPPLLDVRNVIGSVVNLSDLDNVNPKPVTVAIVGLSMVGKTTLRDRVIHAPSQSLRTQAISAQIVRLPCPEDVVVALLDGGGEKLGQQFDLAENCDHLCVLVDHNASSDLIDIDGDRLKQHSAFMSQIRMRIDDRCAPKKSIRLILNKRDLWSKASDEAQAKLMEFRDQEVGMWREGRRGDSVESLMHSNEASADVSGFVLHLKTSAGEGSHAR